MIRPYSSVDKTTIATFLAEDIFQNVYLYIDSQIYGFSCDYVHTDILENSAGIVAVLYRYYDSLQIFTCCQLSDTDLEQISRYIVSNRFSMISGSKECIEDLAKLVGLGYKYANGFVLVNDSCSVQLSGITEFATTAECSEIAELICTDSEIGGHYNANDLAKQLEERMLHRGCRNVVLKKDGKIVSHAATYAESDRIAVIGGLITDDSCRGCGLARKVLADLTFAVKEEGKAPVLFVFKEGLLRWYEKYGWKIASECGKLEMI